MKGSIADMAAIIAVLLGSGISLYLVITILSKFTAGWVAAGHDPTALNQANAAFGLFDGAIVLLLIFLVAVAIIGTFYVATHPVFLPFYIIGVLVLLIIVPQFSNVWDIFRSNSEFATTNAMFPIFNKVMDNLPTLVLMIAVLIGAVLYGKPQKTL